MTTGFVNKKSIILGEDTQAADLTGSLILTEDLDQGQQSDPATTDAGNPSQNSRRNNGILDNAVATFTNIETPDNSVLVIIVATSTYIVNTGSDKDWRIQEDSQTVDTFQREAASGTQIKAELRVFINENPTPGIHTYTVNEDDGNTFGGFVANLFFIKGTDTHAAALIGANTQRSTDESILS